MAGSTAVVAGARRTGTGYPAIASFDENAPIVEHSRKVKVIVRLRVLLGNLMAYKNRTANVHLRRFSKAASPHTMGFRVKV